MTKVKSFLVKIFVVTCFASFLVFSGFFENDTPQPAVSAKDLGYGNPVCDRIIPIGNVMDELLKILDDAFSTYQGENLNTALDTTTGLVTALGTQKDVCDFSECNAEVADTGGKATFEVDAYIKSYAISLDPVPPGWCNADECKGAPCPDVTPYVESDPEKYGIVGLDKLQKSFKSSAAIIHDMFTIATEELSVELVKEGEAVGKAVTKADYLDRLIEYVEYWLTPGHDQSCVLTPLEKKLVASRRMGDKYVSRCEETREQGLYWPRTWSRECEDKCFDAYSDDCLKCLKKNPGKKGSFLAQINYKIYGQCEESCRLKDISGNFTDEWVLNTDCETCLCERPIAAPAGSGGITGGAKEQMSPEECLAWLCGGSTHNWVCCHETPLEGVVERPELDVI